MRWSLVCLALSPACMPLHSRGEPTGVFLAQTTNGALATCEVQLGRTWTEHHKQCGPPEKSWPWYGRAAGAECHLYRVDTQGLNRVPLRDPAPWVAVCTEKVPPGQRDQSLAGQSLIVEVMGLKERPE